MPLNPAIDARDVCVDLGGLRIVEGVNFHMEAGEVVALLGANGSGKSTLVRALTGIVPLASGRVELLGAPLGKKTPWERIGYVPQRAAAATGVPATVEEIVASGLLAGSRLRPRGDIHEQAHRALERVGLVERAHTPIRDLSGGQQQRVLIARALVREPDLLIMDEPVAGVDLESQQAFVEALEGLHEYRTSILVVLHEVGPLSQIVQRAVVIRHGRIVADGPPPRAMGEHADPDHVHVHPHGGDDAPHETGSNGRSPGLIDASGLLDPTDTGEAVGLLRGDQ